MKTREITLEPQSALEPRRRIGQEALDINIRPLPPRRPHNFLNIFSVTTDSVVAKIHLESKEPLRRFLIDWGDFHVDSINILPGQVAVVPEADPLPEGVYEFYHAYDEPEDRRAFTRNILVQMEDSAGQLEIRQAPITVVPKYRLAQYNAYIRLLSRVDSPFEAVAEVDISMKVDGVEVQRWHWEPSNNFFSDSTYFRLEGSAIARDLDLTSPMVDVRFDLTEDDPLFNDHGTIYTPFNIFSAKSETLEADSTGDLFGNVRIRVDRDVRLLRPLPNLGGLATFSQLSQ